jgi:hypothetical protein
MNVEMGLRQRNFQKRNTEMGFSLQCIKIQKDILASLQFIVTDQMILVSSLQFEWPDNIFKLCKCWEIQ